MLKIGLTGGIASGKSAAADCFAARGIRVIDADVIAREVVQIGEPALQEIGAAFGNEVMNPDGSLNRAQLRTLVFADPVKRQKLESILHPRITQAMQHQAAQPGAPYCILAIPLLIEARQEDLVDRILVIDVPAEVQIERLMRRDRVTRQHAEAMLAAQSDRETRLAFADDVIVNAGSRAALEAAVEKLHHRYLDLAATL